ncbi:unnamed protein product [Closterium sp. NIES-54]
MVQQVLQRFDFTYSSPQATPLSTRHSLSALPSDESVEPSGPYPELVGCLIEEGVALHVCSTSGLGLVLGGRRPVVLTGHADASWADDQATQRSSQGYTFSLGSGSVSWRSTRSSSVLGSSCEAEIYAGAMAAQELQWLTYLLADLGEPPRSPPVLYVDNKAMLALCWEHRLEHRTKHIALRYFLARELQQRGQLRLAYVASQANTADIFTKALPPGDHQRFCTMLDCVVFILKRLSYLFPTVVSAQTRYTNKPFYPNGLVVGILICTRNGGLLGIEPIASAAEPIASAAEPIASAAEPIPFDAIRSACCEMVVSHVAVPVDRRLPRRQHEPRLKGHLRRGRCAERRAARRHDPRARRPFPRSLYPALRPLPLSPGCLPRNRTSLPSSLPPFLSFPASPCLSIRFLPPTLPLQLQRVCVTSRSEAGACVSKNTITYWCPKLRRREKNQRLRAVMIARLVMIHEAC